MYRHTTMNGPKFLRWGWHREMLRRVIADIGAFLERGVSVHGPKGPDANPACGDYTPLDLAKNRKKKDPAQL